MIRLLKIRYFQKKKRKMPIVVPYHRHGNSSRIWLNALLKMCNSGFSSLSNFSLNWTSYPFTSMNWHLPHEAFTSRRICSKLYNTKFFNDVTKFMCTLITSVQGKNESLNSLSNRLRKYRVILDTFRSWSSIWYQLTFPFSFI